MDLAHLPTRTKELSLCPSDIPSWTPRNPRDFRSSNNESQKPFILAVCTAEPKNLAIPVFTDAGKIQYCRIHLPAVAADLDIYRINDEVHSLLFDGPAEKFIHFVIKGLWDTVFG
ncbi:MAG: hypothetical protein METHP_01747 [Methanoregula sp. SKADARSKE-2]|nr:MAG: hypothetical protein METHP_01747 [Methanoregula sp. SKADARSKE-2]